MTILQRTVCEVLDGLRSPEQLTRSEARDVLRELQPGRCKGNPYRLLKRRLQRGWTPKGLEQYGLDGRKGLK
jgi:hypothetical protein